MSLLNRLFGKPKLSFEHLQICVMVAQQVSMSTLETVRLPEDKQRSIAIGNVEEDSCET